MRFLPVSVGAALVVILAAASLSAAHAFPSRVSGSYYHSKFEGRTMACGGRFDNGGLTAASNHHPCGSKVRVSYRDRSVVVRITDRCGRCGIDLTRAAAGALGMLTVGRAPVRVERLTGGDGAPVGYSPAEFEEAVYTPMPGEPAAFGAEPLAFIAGVPQPVVEAVGAPSWGAATLPADPPGAPRHVGAVPIAATETLAPLAATETVAVAYPSAFASGDGQ